MKYPEINFFREDSSYTLKNKIKIKAWIYAQIDPYNLSVEDLNIILCSDDYLLKINKNYLNHDTLTDVITFDHSGDSYLSGDIYISVDRVKENAKLFKSLLFDEFLRIIIHGVFHLLKFTDKTKSGKEEMTNLENSAIKKFYDLQ